MRLIILLIALFPIQIYASDVLQDIEIRAAELGSCSVKQPCEITIEKKQSSYIAKVKKSAMTTEYGVLKYKTGSTTYYVFDADGRYLGVKHTT